MEHDLTLIDDGQVETVPASVTGDSVTLSPAALHEALGWTLAPEGLCRGDVCIPVGSASERVNEAGIDLAAFAELVGRPLALDALEAVAALGTAARVRAEALGSLQAPDFSLPDLQGVTHSLSDFHGKKVLLVAYASW
jgi:hypothetical protein